MDCDGLKKNLLQDIDGTFLGRIGSVISQSEFGWGSQARGLGDFRIPKEALSDLNGHRLSPSSIYTYPGIIRGPNCTYISTWQAWECFDIDYRMLVIESMDTDTETRRLSPIAIISDSKYLDLINGPQDHGWCFGYTCQKRISTFLALVANNHHFDIYLSSTPPNRLRFTLLNADSNFKIRLSMYYSTSNNVDVYKNVNYVAPTNRDVSPKNGANILLDPQGSINQYKPNITSAPGTNFLYRDERKLYFSMDGSDYIDLVIAPEIYLKFGVAPTTADQFFNSLYLVSNIANLLGVPPNMIRRVEIVNETTTSRVLKRATGTQYLIVIIANDPVTSTTNTAAYNTALNTINAIAANITNQAQTNQLQDIAQQLYNLTLSTVYIREMPNATLSNDTSEVELQIVSSIQIQQDISGCREQSECDTQPIIKVLDQNNKLIAYLGSESSPWYISVNIKSTINATQLVGSLQAPVINGYAKFDGLALSNRSSGVILEFKFVTPTGVSSSRVANMNATSSQFSVGAAVLTCMQYESSIKVYNNTKFNASFGIVSINTYTPLQNINLNGATWTASISLYSLSQYQPNGVLNASSNTASFPSNTNNVQFSNLLIKTPGMYILKSEMRSSDNVYSISCFSNPVQINSTNVTTSFTADFIPNFIFTFTGTYSSLNAGQYKAMLYNYLTNKFDAVVVGDVYVYTNSSDGTIGVAANVAPNTIVYSSIVNSSLSYPTSILPGFNLTSISVYDTKYTAKASTSVEVSAPTSNPINQLVSATTNNVAAIIGGCVAAVVVAALASVGGVFLYRYIKQTKSSTVGNQSNIGKLLDQDIPQERYVNDGITISRDLDTTMTDLKRTGTPISVKREPTTVV